MEKTPKTKKTLFDYKLEALRSQMDPHFIFNAITAVQHFILNNDKRAAISYLDVVSQLIRKFLEHSRKNSISLSEELDLLIAYINLESLRFSDKFGFVVHLDEEIDAEDYAIPPMLIQPFVENAIKHGLLHKSDYGLLKINFSLLDEKRLRVVVEDDGIGVVRSKELNKWKQKSHSSLAIDMVQERLEILSQMHKQKLTLQIEAAQPGQKDCGTKVTVILPVL